MNCQKKYLHDNNHGPALASLFHVPVSMDDLLQRPGPVDVRFQFSLFHDAFYEFQVFPLLFRRPQTGGGEEFIIFGYEETAATLANLAERLRKSVLEMEVVYRDEQIRFTLSIGIASSTEANSMNIDSVIAKADERLYTAKRGGRNRVVFQDEEENPQTGTVPEPIPITS